MLVPFKLVLLITNVIFLVDCNDISIDSTTISSHNNLFTINGKVNIKDKDFDFENTRILIDDGLFIGYLRADGSFSISGIPSNSYIVEVSSPKTAFEPVRVDITSNGKIRSRKLNLIEPKEVKKLQYPLNFESKGTPNYFKKKEKVRILDIITNPVVIMIGMTLLMYALTNLIQMNPEMQEQMQNQPTLLPTRNIPNLSEIVYNIFNRFSNRNTGQQRRVVRNN